MHEWEEDDIRGDHARYRALSKGVVRNLIRHGFTADDDERVRRYLSRKAFAEAYPDSVERVRMLSNLSRHMQALRVGMKRIKQVIVDLF